MNNTKRIIKVTIKRLDDPMGEADYLGKYSNTPGPADRTIDRKARGDQGQGEMRYFIAENSAKDTGNPGSVEQDYRRMEAGNNGEWHFIGIRAEAEVCLTGATVQRLTSGGLWGIESDAGEGEHRQIEDDQLDELQGELLAVGFSEAEIKVAFENVEKKSDY
jgi:hypothetical protein